MSMLSTAGANAALNAIAALITHISVHTAIPNDSGNNEATGGSPAYARKAPTWASASARSVAISNNPVFDLPAGTFTHYGLWSALTAGTYYGKVPINGGATTGVGSVSDASTDTIRSNGHGLVNTDRVAIGKPIGEALQGALSETTLYYVVGSATDTFQLSLTSGGSAVDIALGELTWQKVIPETYGAQGTLTTNSLSLTL